VPHTLAAVSPVASTRPVLVASLAAAVIAAVVFVVVVIAPGGGGSRARGPGPVTQRPTTSSPTTPSPVRSEQFGASVNLLFLLGPVSAAQRGAQLRALHATGATLARTDALWENAEPSPPIGGIHHYDWTFDGQIAASLAASHLRWLPIVDYTAGWAQSIPGQDHSPPSSSADYAAYAAALAARYGPDGSFWRAHPELPALPVDAFEIWNEPDNLAFWVPRPDAARYAQLYTAARDAIHAVDPSAHVVVGGLSAPTMFLPQLLAADPQLRGKIDGVAIHPYAGSPSGVLGNVRQTRRVLKQLGLATVPLYVTEFGWTTRPPGALEYLSERLRPSYIERTLVDLGSSGCNIAAAVLYTWFSPQSDPRNKQYWFGISPPGAQGSPDVTAFATGLRKAALAGPSGRGC
jgi:polysaccharide biosynthesis protein PslG